MISKLEMTLPVSKTASSAGFHRQCDFASNLADTFAEMILDRNTMYHRESVVNGLVAKPSGQKSHNRA